MKILYYIEGLGSGGKERRLVELIKALSNYPDIKMELVLTREEIHYQDVLTSGIKINYTYRKGLKKDPKVFYKFYNIVKEFKPDIINVWGNMLAVYAIPAKILLGVPMINNQITNAPLKIQGGLLSHKFTFLFSDRIIANTYAGLKSYNAPKNKSSVIHNGFDFSRIKNVEDKDKIRKTFQIETQYVVGMVATFYPIKDYKTYINAAISILSKRKDVTFLCIGAGDDTEYREMVPEHFKMNIKFLGRQKNVESIMNICDIGVLSTYTEGISNSLMEFMALGKPVIATDGGGTSELVVHGESGYLVPAVSPDEMADKIEYLLNCSDCIQKMGKSGIDRIKHEFSLNKMIESFIKIYKSYDKSQS